MERSIYILLGNEKGLCKEHGKPGFSEYFVFAKENKALCN